MNQRIFRLQILVVMTLALLCGACVQTQRQPVTPRPVISSKDEVKALLRLGENRLLQGRNALAADAFRAALAQKPEPNQATNAMLGLATALDRQGNHQASLDWALRLLAFDPYSPLAPKAELLAAKQESALGQNIGAASRLRRILSQPGMRLKWEERLQAHRMLAQALDAAGRSLEAVNAYIELAKQGGPETLETVSEKLALAAGKLSPRNLENLLSASNPPQIKTALKVGLAHSYVRQGKLNQADQTVRQLKVSPYGEAFFNQLQNLEKQISQARLVKPKAIGVILPLSGPYASHGQRVLAAIELGLGLFDSSSSNQVTLYIEDSKSTPAEAAKAVTRLVQKNRVMAILGPLGAATSLAAARRAQELKTPLLTITQVQGVTQAGEYIFQNFFTPEEQVDALLGEVMGERGLTKFAVLAPNTSYGKGFAGLLSKGVTKRGGSNVKTIYYNPKATDFTDEIKRLVHLPPGNYRPGRPDSPKPRIDFEALFLPDSPSQIGMIAPQLAYFDITGVVLMGTNLWHNPRLLNLAGRYVANCLFPDAFAQDSQAPKVRNFITAFTETLQQKPNVLDAHAYDAASILRSLLQQPNPCRTREEMRQALSDVRMVPGICGELSMGVDRRLRKELILYTVINDQFRLYQGPIEGLAQPFGENTTPSNPQDAINTPNQNETDFEETRPINSETLSEAPAAGVLR